MWCFSLPTAPPRRRSLVLELSSPELSPPCKELFSPFDGTRPKNQAIKPSCPYDRRTTFVPQKKGPTEWSLQVPPAENSNFSNYPSRRAFSQSLGGRQMLSSKGRSHTTSLPPILVLSPPAQGSFCKCKSKSCKFMHDKDDLESSHPLPSGNKEVNEVQNFFTSTPYELPDKEDITVIPATPENLNVSAKIQDVRVSTTKPTTPKDQSIRRPRTRAHAKKIKASSQRSNIALKKAKCIQILKERKDSTPPVLKITDIFQKVKKTKLIPTPDVSASKLHKTSKPATRPIRLPLDEKNRLISKGNGTKTKAGKAKLGKYNLWCLNFI